MILDAMSRQRAIISEGLGCWSSVMPAGARTSTAYPFSRLRTDRFWHSIPTPGYDADTEYNVSSMERLREMYFGAKMDDELFAFMAQPGTREHLRMVLINTYFAPKIHPLLIRIGKVNQEAYAYRQGLLAGVSESRVQWGAESEHACGSRLFCHVLLQGPCEARNGTRSRISGPQMDEQQNQVCTSWQGSAPTVLLFAHRVHDDIMKG
jgi:hypothetical protein